MQLEECNGTGMGHIGSGPDSVLSPGHQTEWIQWAGAVLGACLVGLTGVLPLFVIPVKCMKGETAKGETVKGEASNESSSNETSDDNLKYLLAFAVGGLLGDVFLHLLPETYQHVLDSGEEDGLARVGMATLTGILAFLVLEKVLEMSNPETNPELREKENRKIVGYLNLLANCTDNLLHGLAVGSSFLSSTRLGITTTAAILLHEIPHEFGDFAILLKSGFDRGEAARAQISTALVGLLGALVALAFETSDGLEALLMYILPFTAGGFLNIALVSVVPELMQERRPWPALGQFLSLLAGIMAMSLLTMI